MSTLKVNNLQVGQDSTATNNLTWFQPGTPDGTIRLGSGNAGSATSKFTFDKDGNLTCVGTITATSIEGTIDDWITHLGDTDTRYGFPAADTFAVETAGDERLRITSTGVVGVGTDTPDGKGIDVLSSRTNAYGATSDHRGLAHIIARNASDAPDRFASISLVSGGGTQAEGSINLVQTGNYTGDLTFKSRTAVSAWTEKLRIKSDGVILIGPGAVDAPKASTSGLDISSGLYSIIMGGETNVGTGDGRRNSQQKEARLAMPHYTNAEEPFGLVYGVTLSGENRLNLGGGSSIVNAATSIKFYTATNTTSTAGTERLTINSTGHLTIGEANFTASNDVHIKRANAGGDVAIRITNNSNQNSGTKASLYFTTSPTQDFNTAYIQAIRDGGKLNFGYGTDAPTLTMKVSTAQVGIGVTDPTAMLDIDGAYNKHGLRVTSGAAGYQDPLIVRRSTGGDTFRVSGNGAVVTESSMFTHYNHLICQGGSGGNAIKNYILVCKTNSANVRLSGHFVITRQSGASGIAISKIEANIISNDSAGDFRYQTRSFSTRGSYPGMEGRWVTLTYGGNNYYAIRLDPATDSSRWASQPQHCYFTGTQNNCVGNGLGTIIDDNANTISSITELDDIQGTTVVRNSYNYIKEGYLSVQGGDGQQACIIQPYELNVNTGSQPIPLTVKSQKNTILELNRLYTQGVMLQFRQNNDARGYFNNAGTTTTYYNQGSDERLKTNFEEWSEEVLPHFKSLKPKKFNWIEDAAGTPKVKGFIAQENLNKFPEAYHLNEDDRYWFSGTEMVPYLMKALQEEIIKREAIESKYNALESRISALESSS